MKVGGLNFKIRDHLPEGKESVVKIRYKDKGTLANVYSRRQHRESTIFRR